MRESLIEKRILIIDDEPELREILCDEFTYLGAKPVGASGISEAFNILDAQKIDGIITDLRMPGGGGEILLEKIFEKFEQPPPIVVITGFSEFTDIDAYHNGASAYLRKPLDYDLLIDTTATHQNPIFERWLNGPRGAKGSNSQQPFRLASGAKIENGVEQLLSFNFGRGGFYAEINGELPRVGTLIEFSLKIESGASGSISGIGSVRWRRPERVGKLPRGCGIEILQIETESIHDAFNLSKISGRSFIPKQ